MILSRKPLAMLILTVMLASISFSSIAESTLKAPLIKSRARPMELTELLKLLPTCPDTWIINRSQARTLYQDNLEAYAMREFEEFIPPSVKGAKDAPKPETVIIVIRDTCGQGPHLEPFREETAPTSGGDFKLGNWNRYPAMLVRMGAKRQALRVLVGNRFVVEVVFSGNNLKSLKWWLERCDLKTLAHAKQQRQLIVNDQVALDFLDELHPERTRSYSVPLETKKPDTKKPAASPEKAPEVVSD